MYSLAHLTPASFTEQYALPAYPPQLHINHVQASPDSNTIPPGSALASA